MTLRNCRSQSTGGSYPHLVTAQARRRRLECRSDHKCSIVLMEIGRLRPLLCFGAKGSGSSDRKNEERACCLGPASLLTVVQFVWWDHLTPTIEDESLIRPGLFPGKAADSRGQPA
jgi:hypothetical protein